MKKKDIRYILYGIILIIFDQLIKYIISKVNSPVIVINNFLKFDFIKNDGAAFGILGGNTLVIIILTLLLIGYLVYDLKNNLNNKLQLTSYLLILSGAIGNLIDRVYFKYVRDFISFRLFNKDMAIFNLADIYITFGVILFIFIMVRDGINERNSSGK